MNEIEIEGKSDREKIEIHIQKADELLKTPYCDSGAFARAQAHAMVALSLTLKLMLETIEEITK